MKNVKRVKFSILNSKKKREKAELQTSLYKISLKIIIYIKLKYCHWDIVKNWIFRLDKLKIMK